MGKQGTYTTKGVAFLTVASFGTSKLNRNLFLIKSDKEKSSELDEDGPQCKTAF